MQTIPSAQLRFPDGGAELVDNSEGPLHWASSGMDAKQDSRESVADQSDETEKTQRESDQEEYALGDRPDGDFSHDEQVAGA